MPQLLILDKEQLQIQMAIEEMLTDTLQSRLSSVLELEVVLKVRFSMYNQPSIPIDRLGHNDMCVEQLCNCNKLGCALCGKCGYTSFCRNASGLVSPAEDSYQLIR